MMPPFEYPRRAFSFMVRISGDIIDDVQDTEAQAAGELSCTKSTDQRAFGVASTRVGRSCSHGGAAGAPLALGEAFLPTESVAVDP